MSRYIDADRTDQYLPLTLVRSWLRRLWTLDETNCRTGGPAPYVTVRETGQRLGFITPTTHNFRESCNRVRLSGSGTLYSTCTRVRMRRRPAPCPAVRRHG